MDGLLCSPISICFVLELTTSHRGVNSFLKLGGGGQVLMRVAAGARWCLLFCQNMGRGNCPPLIDAPEPGSCRQQQHTF